MKHFIKYYFLLFTFYFLFSSCDKVKNPYVNTHNSAVGCPNPVFPAKAFVRKVLVEDYTGHRCVNCPPAAVTLENIRAVYPTQVVGIAVHANFWAEPSPCNPPPGGLPSDAFYHYLGCPAAENYFTSFGFASNPNGMVNRIPVGGSPVISNGTWKSVVDTIVTKPPVADINIFTNYNNSTNKLCVSCKTTFLNAMQGTFNLSILFVEDSIFDWQAFAGSDSSNYLFRYVVRDDINGAGTGFGPTIKINPALNDTVVSSYSYSVPTGYAFTSASCPAPLAVSPCNPSHCYVVAFIYDGNSASATYREIIQAEIKKIYP
jgi:hypothetical protein